jgi:tetratricopeptide (TPR) repeat protein
MSTPNSEESAKSNISLEEIANTSIAQEPRLDGIPLSCRLKYAQTISDDFSQAYELSDIARTYAEFGFYDQALGIHAFLTSKGSGNSTTGDLIELFAERELFSQAIQLIEEEIGSSAKNDWLTIVAQKAAQVGRIDTALKLANTMQDSVGIYKSKILAEIAAGYAKSGQQDKADKFFEQSLQLADDRASALFYIAKSYADAKYYEKAFKLLDIAREQSADKEADVVLTETLLRIARIAIKNEQFEPANNALFKALKIAGTPSAFQAEPSWLAEIATHYAEIGQFEEALDIAKGIDVDSRKLEALLRIARQYWQGKHFDQADKVFKSARELAETPKIDNKVNPDGNVYKSRNLVQLADAYRGIGQVEIANQTLNEAFQAARVIQELDDQAREVSSIAREYVKIKTYDQALIAAETIKDTKERENLTELIRCIK